MMDRYIYHTYYSTDITHTLGNSTILDFGFNHLNAIIFQIKVNFAAKVSRDKKKLGSKYIIFLLEPDRMVGNKQTNNTSHIHQVVFSLPFWLEFEFQSVGFLDEGERTTWR